MQEHHKDLLAGAVLLLFFAAILLAWLAGVAAHGR